MRNDDWRRRTHAPEADREPGLRAQSAQRESHQGQARRVGGPGSTPPRRRLAARASSLARSASRDRDQRTVCRPRKGPAAERAMALQSRAGGMRPRWGRSPDRPTPSARHEISLHCALGRRCVCRRSWDLNSTTFCRLRLRPTATATARTSAPGIPPRTSTRISTLLLQDRKLAPCRRFASRLR
jgi:hypothetical protein